MDAQIVDDQKNLLLRVLDETLHEIDEDRHVQRALVEPEPHQAAIAHCGDHARRKLLSSLRQDRRLSFRRVTAADLIPVADAGLVAPVDRRLLALRPRRDRRIVLLQPGRDLLRIALRRAGQRFLCGKAPTLQIELHRRKAERLAELLVLISSLICLHSRGIFERWFLKECGDFLWGVLERAHGREHFSLEGLFAVGRRAPDRVRLQMVPHQLVWI
jgi:hypothetical protein